MTDFSTITPTQWKALSDSEIGEILGVSSRTVRRERERERELMKLPQVRRRPPGRPPITIEFDPTKSNKENAERMGVSVQWAAKLRKEWI